VGEVSTIGLDLAKTVFQAHGADASGEVVFRKKLRRDKLLAFFAGQPRCLVAMEACASAHYWAREIAALGHETKLIPPAYVKPFVKRQKNDMADAEAICEAAQRPTMRFVRPKSAEAQGAAVIFRTRDLLVRQRTQLINALRNHADACRSVHWSLLSSGLTPKRHEAVGMRGRPHQHISQGERVRLAAGNTGKMRGGSQPPAAIAANG